MIGSVCMCMYWAHVGGRGPNVSVNLNGGLWMIWRKGDSDGEFGIQTNQESFRSLSSESSTASSCEPLRTQPTPPSTVNKTSSSEDDVEANDSTVATIKEEERSIASSTDSCCCHIKLLGRWPTNAFGCWALIVVMATPSERHRSDDAVQRTFCCCCCCCE